MTTPPSLPTISGLGWSVHKNPRFNTVVSKHPSGADVRTALWINPAYEFEVTYDALASNASFPGLGTNSWQTLIGFFLSLGGMWGQFLYTDPTDNSVTGQAIGTGDGATTVFPLVRTLGGFTEPVGWVTSAAIYLNAALQSSGYTLTTPNTLTFTSAPGSGVLVTADITYSFLCRMDDDGVEFEEFMSNLHSVKSFKFRTLRLQ